MLNKTNIIIPIGGIGKRFSDYNYSLPKPLIKSLGESIIIRCINSLNIGKNDTIYIPYRVELDNYNFRDILNKEFDLNFKFIPIDFDTRGAAETVLLALDNMGYQELIKPTIVVDSDNIYNDDIINDFKSINDNVIFYFEDKNDKPLFSYIKVEESIVTDIKEKVKISNFACSGGYGFKSGKTLKEYITKTIKHNEKSKNEFYISTIYYKMLIYGETIKASKCDDYICLGTPEQLKIYSSNINENNKMRFCFDFDNTLVTFPKIKNDYSSVEPIYKNIEYVRFLKEQGHTIIIYTARRMKTHKGNVGAIVADVGKITINTLNKFNIPYDELYFGKPYANFYIDDLAIKAYDDLEKELGFYNLHPETRSHNKIEIYDDKIVKYSTDIKGEKYWYLNKPNGIHDMFPELLDYTDNSITISRINGMPLSHLNANGILTKEILNNVLDSLKSLHFSGFDDDIDIYANYMDKLNTRLDIYDFSKYHGVDNLIEELKEFFNNYKTSFGARNGVIHGDPVFTNILIDNFDNLKFIDMRGKVGDSLTTCGDIFYDYAKVYQSIIGYDFILMGKTINNEIVESNKEIFHEFILNNFGETVLNNIKWITKSLLLTLIPLHDNDKCNDYYNLITKIETKKWEKI